MDASLIGQLLVQHGLVTLTQLRRLGYDVDEVRRMVHLGELIGVRRAVYADPVAWAAAATRWDRRQVLVDLAGSLATRSHHRFSHDSAALQLGMQVLQQDGRTHLTHCTRRGTHTRAGITHHYASYRDADEYGAHLLTPARTALDIAREHGVRAGTVAVDSARRLGASLGELEAALDVMQCWPGRRSAIRAIEASEPDTDSIAETLGRELVVELGHGRPETQFGLAAEGRVVWCDLRLGRHIFEVDGELKYRLLNDGGVSVDPRLTLWEEKRRHDFITGFKVGISRLTWGDFFGPQREAARRRLAREYAATVARFGTDIGDLTAYRPRTPRPRPGFRLPPVA